MKFSNLNKGERLKIIAFIVLIALCVSMIPLLSFGDEPLKNDVSDHVKIGNVDVQYKKGGNWETYITDGVIKEKDKVFEKGTVFKFFVRWSVTSGGIENIDYNDYFMVDIPSGYFEFSNNIDPYEVIYEDKSIGMYSIKDDKMLFAFSQLFDKNDNNDRPAEIKNGWLMAQGTLNATDIPGNKVDVGGVEIPTIATKPSIELQEKTTPEAIWKGGEMDEDGYTAQWSIEANSDMLFHKVNDNGQFKTRKNVVIEDKMCEHQKFTNLSISHLFYFVNENGKIIDDYFKIPYTLSKHFKEIESSPSSIEYSEFKKEVIENSPAYGVWDERYVVISLGDLPGKLKTPVDKETFEAYVNTQKVSKKVKESTIKAYSEKIFQDEGSAPAYAFKIAIDARVNGYNGNIVNNVDMSWNDNDSASDGKTLVVETIKGGAELGETGEAIIKKIDGDTKSKLDGVQFKLMKEIAAGKYEEYESSDGEVIKSTSDGTVIFKKLPYGNYRVVEVKTLEGYKKEMKFTEGDGTFTIDGDTTKTAFVTAENFTENKPVLDDINSPVNDRGEDLKQEKTGRVKGENAGPKTPEVKGENAKTADISNITPLLIVMLAVMIILLLAALQNSFRKD